jgi:hypothetical protein
MRVAILTYFAGEKSAGVLVALVGLLGLAAALFFSQPRWELRPLAVTLGVLALVEVALGVGLFLRTGPQVDQLLAQLASEAARFYTEEGARMAKVQRNFVTLERVWIGLVTAGSLVAVTQKHRPWISGIALGLLLNAAFLLAFDLVAERRGAIYLREIERGASGQ